MGLIGGWRAPRLFDGRGVLVIGGGASIREAGQGDVIADLARLTPTIAINDAFLLAPHADVLYWADARWCGWNRPDLARHHGLKVTRSAASDPGAHEAMLIGWERTLPYSRNPSRVAGFCGGGNAINLAALMGAAAIVLVGFDMRPGNWHDRHRRPPVAGQHEERFRPAIERMAPELAADGIIVVNATPESVLGCFATIDLAAVAASPDGWW